MTTKANYWDTFFKLHVCTADVPKVNPSATTTTNRLIGTIYDASGNTTEGAKEWTFIYNADNKLIEVKDDQDITLGEYSYDGEGKKIVSEV